MAKISTTCFAWLTLGSMVTLGFVIQDTASTRSQISGHVRARNIAKLHSLSAGELVRDNQAFAFLALGGVYGGGNRGWEVAYVKDPAVARELAVVHTPTGAEDIGSQVFVLREGKLIAKIPESDRQGFDLHHHDMRVDLDPTTMKLTVTDRFKLRRSGPSSGSLVVRLGSHLTVRKVIDASGAKVPFAQGGGVVAMAAPAQSTEYTIEYDGKINLPFIGGMTRQDEMSLAGDLWYPTLGRWPASMRATVRFPQGWLAVGPGVGGAVTTQGSQSEQTFDMRLPTSFISLTVGKFRQREIKSGGFTVRTVSATMSDADMDTQNRISAPVFAYLSKFAPNPFPSFTFLESRCMFGGALEAYSHATYNQGWLPDEEPHEPSHTWFGGIVPNTYLTSLWNESFASWFETHYKRENGICPKAEARRAFVEFPAASQAFDRFPVAGAGSEQGSDASSLGYQKGAYVLQMLENMIGPDLMVASIQEFFRRAKPGAPAEWPDFEAACEATVGEDLSWFFDQWLRRTGAPRFTLTNPTWAKGKFSARVNWTGPSYKLPTEALIRFRDGTEAVVKATITGASHVTIECKKAPKSVTFDPLNRMLRHRNQDDFAEPLDRILARVKRFVAPGQEKLEAKLVGRARIGQKLTGIPSNLRDVALFVAPTEPKVGPILRRFGITVAGSKVTWSGTTVDITKGGLLLKIPTGDGWTIIACGNLTLAPRLGRATLALFDQYGRAVRARTDPFTTGSLTLMVP